MNRVRSSKNKGVRLQNKVRDKIIEYFPELEGLVRCAVMGESGNDVVVESNFHRLFPFAVECKARKQVALLYEMIAQAERNAGDELTPIGVIKKDHAQPLVVLKIDDFLRLAQL